MEKIARFAGAHVGAIEAHNMEALVLHPDASLEAPAVVFFDACYVKHEAAHFTEKLTARILEFIMLFVETGRVDINHLQEAARQELHGHGQESSQPARGVLQIGSALIAGERFQV